MLDLVRTIVKLSLLAFGLFCIYLMLSTVIKHTNKEIQQDRNGTAEATVVSSYVSVDPFGTSTNIVKRDSQIFYNMQIQRTIGQYCYVKTSWRWVLHLKSGNTVMWNKSDGEFYVGDKNENLAQSVMVPPTLIPGDYTLSRLSIFKCGDVDDFARSVRNIDLRVE